MDTYLLDRLTCRADATMAQLVKRLGIVNVGDHDMDLMSQPGEPFGQTPGVTLRAPDRGRVGMGYEHHSHDGLAALKSLP